MVSYRTAPHMHPPVAVFSSLFITILLPPVRTPAYSAQHLIRECLDLRPQDVIRVSMFKRLIADRIADISIPISQRQPLAKATFEYFAASI